MLRDLLQAMDAVRYEARQIIAEGVAKRYPLILSVFAVRLMFKKRGLPQPDDVLAFAFDGKINMTMVHDWELPYGS